MVAITLEQAKTAAVAIVVGLVVVAVGWAWLVKTLVQKAIGVLVILALAAAVWFQRDSLQDCADQIRDVQVSGTTAGVTAGVDATCSFFGQDVRISASR